MKHNSIRNIKFCAMRERKHLQTKVVLMKMKKIEFKRKTELATAKNKIDQKYYFSSETQEFQAGKDSIDFGIDSTEKYLQKVLLA